MNVTPGLKTSEFKAAALTVIASCVAVGANWISARYGFGAGVLGAISYVVSRGLAKYETPGSPPPTA